MLRCDGDSCETEKGKRKIFSILLSICKHWIYYLTISTDWLSTRQMKQFICILILLKGRCVFPHLRIIFMDRVDTRQRDYEKKEGKIWHWSSSSMLFVGFPLFSSSAFLLVPLVQLRIYIYRAILVWAKHETISSF